MIPYSFIALMTFERLGVSLLYLFLVPMFRIRISCNRIHWSNIFFFRYSRKLNLIMISNFFRIFYFCVYLEVKSLICASIISGKYILLQRFIIDYLFFGISHYYTYITFVFTRLIFRTTSLLVAYNHLRVVLVLQNIIRRYLLRNCSTQAYRIWNDFLLWRVWRMSRLIFVLLR